MNTSNKYYWDNREARLAYGAKWRKENKDKMETARKRWSDANPDYVKKIYPSKVGKDVLRERAYVENGGKLVVPLPKVKIIDSTNI